MNCRGATSACITTPARTYRRWPGNEPLVLCDPEWVRRLTARDNSKLEDTDAITALVARRRQLTVDSCRECNTLLDGLYFDTLAERTAYVKRRLAIRHRCDLQTPEWPARDLMEMAPHLRDFILGSLQARDLTRARLQWEPSRDPGKSALQVIADARWRRKKRTRSA